MHHFDPAQLRILLASDRAKVLSAPARKRLEWIVFFANSGLSISETCTHLGISRSTFHRWLERFEPNDLSSLEEKIIEHPLQPVSTVAADTVELIRDYRMQFPHIGKEKLRALLLEKHNTDLSSSTIGRIMERECMYFGNTPLHWRKRLYREREDGPAVHPETPSANVAQETISVVTAQTEESVAGENPVTDEHKAHDCLYCRVRNFNWRRISRAFAFASVVTNIALISLYLATAWMESNGKTVRADLTTYMSPVQTVVSLDLPQSDER